MSGKPYVKPEERPEPDGPRMEECNLPGCSLKHPVRGPGAGD